MNTAIHSLSRHHLVLDHTLTSASPGTFATVLQTPHRFRRASYDSQKIAKLQRRRIPIPRQNSYDSSASDSSATSWSEYTVRKSLVKFRTRKGAKRWSGRKRLHRTPSNTIQKVLDNVYRISKSEKTTCSEKLFAVLYSWFFGWIIDVYYSLTDDGRERSFVKWSLASALVTGTVILIISFVTLGLYYLNFVLLSLLNASLFFSTTLLVSGVTFLGLLAIMNYD